MSFFTLPSVGAKIAVKIKGKKLQHQNPESAKRVACAFAGTSGVSMSFLTLPSVGAKIAVKIKGKKL